MEKNSEEISPHTLAENSLTCCRTEVFSSPPALLPDPAEPPSWEHVALNTHTCTCCFWSEATNMASYQHLYPAVTQINILQRRPNVQNLWDWARKNSSSSCHVPNTITNPIITPEACTLQHSDINITINTANFRWRHSTASTGRQSPQHKECLYDLYSLLQTGTPPPNLIHTYYT